MAQTITFRPDANAERALAVLTADGTAVSAAVRAALNNGCASRRKRSPPMPRTGPRPHRCCATWRHCVRGDIHQLKAPRASRGHEQRGPRFAVIVQSDSLPLSTLLVAPTSTSARAASFRPEILLGGISTRVLVEQTAAVDPNRLGEQVGHLGFHELRPVDAALRIVLEL